MTIRNESKEDRIARLGAVKGTTSGKQVEGKAKYRAKRYGALNAFTWRMDDATHEAHIEADVTADSGERKHIDVYVEKEELIEALTLMGWL